MKRVGGLSVRVVPGAKAIDIADAGGVPVATLTFAIPGEPVKGWEPDDEDVLLVSTPDVVSRLRVVVGAEQVALQVTVDNRRAHPVELPYLGLGVAPGPGFQGWCWSSDLDAVVAVSPRSGESAGLVLRLAGGFLRPARDVPVFGPAVRAEVPSLWPDESARGAFHLAPPGALLGAHKRHSVALTVRDLGSLGEVAAELPHWLPTLIALEGCPIEIALPDQAIVPGDGVRATVVDTDVSLVGEPGHRQVAVHGPRGVGRLRLTWAPDLRGLVTTLVDEVVRRRAAGASDAAGYLVVEAVARGWALDPDQAFDWLDQVDWLERDSLLGDATAGVLAGLQREATQFASAWRLLAGREVAPGYGLVVMRLWLAGLAMSGDTASPAHGLLARPAGDEASQVELALLSFRSTDALGRPLGALIDRLGGPLPGSPLSVSGPEAALAISLLRLCPESWERRIEATEAATKAERLLLADFAPSVDGKRPSLPLDALAWLLLGQLGI